MVLSSILAGIQRWGTLALALGLLAVLLADPLAKPGAASQAKPAQSGPQWKTYRDPRVPFEFSYPANLFLDAHVNPKLGFIFALMRKSDAAKYDWLIDVDYQDRAEFQEPPYSTMSFEEFAIARARTGCDADGPEGSVSCPALVRSRAFTNRFDLEVIEFSLKQVEERIEPPSTRQIVIGPLYAVRLPAGNFDKVLTFKLTEKGRNQHLNNGLLKQIAASVRLAR
jgi:hypothetical protein